MTDQNPLWITAETVVGFTAQKDFGGNGDEIDKAGLVSWCDGLDSAW